MARLLDVLREDLRLTGTKEGCGEGECGACSVLVNGELVNSCLMPVLQADGADDHDDRRRRLGDGTLHAVQQAFIEHGGAQCGICTPGMILAVDESARAASASDRGGDSHRPRRQSVPLHGLHADLRGRRARQRDGARRQRRRMRALSFRRTSSARSRPRSTERAVPARAEPGRVASVRRRHRSHGAARGRQAARGPIPRPVEARELRGIDDRSGRASSIGALTTYTDVLRACDALRASFRCCCRAAAETGGIATQNRGTIGGNIANASPAADTPPALLVYDAELELVSARGIAASAVRPLPSRLQEDGPRARRAHRAHPSAEAAARSLQYYRKVGTRRAQAISKVCLAVTAQRRGLAGLRTSASPSAASRRRCVRARTRKRRFAVASRIAPRSTQAQHALLQDIAPIDDIRSTARYRAARRAGTAGAGVPLTADRPWHKHGPCPALRAGARALDDVFHPLHEHVDLVQRRRVVTNDPRLVDLALRGRAILRRREVCLDGLQRGGHGRGSFSNAGRSAASASVSRASRSGIILVA